MTFPINIDLNKLAESLPSEPKIAKVSMAERPEYHGCTCEFVNHDHVGMTCSRPPTIRGGSCNTCRYWATFER